MSVISPALPNQRTAQGVIAADLAAHKIATCLKLAKLGGQPGESNKRAALLVGGLLQCAVPCSYGCMGVPRQYVMVRWPNTEYPDLGE